jgi:hypothetical protein
MNFTNYR